MYCRGILNLSKKEVLNGLELNPIQFLPHKLHGFSLCQRDAKKKNLPLFKDQHIRHPNIYEIK